MTDTESTRTNSTTESTEKAERARPVLAISEENLAALLRATTSSDELEEPVPAKHAEGAASETGTVLKDEAKVTEALPRKPVESKLAMIAAIKEHRSAILRSEASAPTALSPELPAADEQPTLEATALKKEPAPEPTVVREAVRNDPPELKVTPLQTWSLTSEARMPASLHESNGTSRKRLVIGLIAGAVILVAGFSALLMWSGKSKSTAVALPLPAINFPQPTSESMPAMSTPAPASPQTVPPSITSSEPVAPAKPPSAVVQPSQPKAREFIPPPSAAHPTEQRAILDAPSALPAGTSASPMVGLPPAVTAISLPPAADASTRQIRVESKLQAANLIQKVAPSYPPLAKATRIQGIVRFTAVIGKDGRIQNLKVNSGQSLLIEAATNAVKQWVYRPTLLNGEPVEVVTQIDVNFTLSQ